MADDIRTKAMKVIDDAGIPALGGQINSNGATEAKFTELTGGAPITCPGEDHKVFPSRQKFMEHSWVDHKSQMTACNEFVGWYRGKLGIKENLGRFDIESYLKTINKDYAWVKSTTNVRPKPGDILRHTAYHMDVCLYFKDDVLYRVGAGQGTVGSFDILKRIQGSGPYDYTKLQGWVDIDLYVNGPPSPPPPPPPPQQQQDGGAQLWFNRDGDLVNPDSPDGGGGPGFFRVAGPLSPDPDQDLPYPGSRAARNLDPVEMLDREENA
jgi:hypothetical protein